MQTETIVLQCYDLDRMLNSSSFKTCVMLKAYVSLFLLEPSKMAFAGILKDADVAAALKDCAGVLLPHPGQTLQHNIPTNAHFLISMTGANRNCLEVY